MFGNDLFTSMSDRLKKKRLMEERIDKEAYDAGNTMLYNVHENQDTRFGSVNPHGMGVKPVYETTFMAGDPTKAYNEPGAPIDYKRGAPNIPAASQVVPQVTQTGLAPTNTASALNAIQPTNAVSDAPKRDLDFTSYSKSLDKSFMMAALQSAIPEDQPAPSGISGGGAHGGGENLGNMQEYASAERRKKKNPALWRYS
jgi:hypothetical protein